MARKLGRTTDARMALLRNLATDLIIHERIETTEAKAKDLRSVVEKMITLGKRGDLHARRQAASFLYRKDASETEDAVQKLFNDVAKRYEDRQGGYTRVLKLGERRGDGAKMAIIELV
ncbi:MAG: 50S ribosomal protein L17 [Bacillota bacterium]|uniref:Large ribosomal subunit protein bL17 n=3 Tax=Halolactibacillus TaxID=306539 RepID=A0A511X1S6_9BACI|nr:MULTISPECIES: 50S ribosomal protein L17 [Halolactibacillus]SFO83336.1 LSU ribosomal protein L17P [Halolactibacillus alkaliphilus]SFP31702.1 large subunit ribosomal protein L17 [Halolactibacillus halophilus]SFS92058.1 large subunit ribosomal protein L17 [Halolactibacillus miurensis]GEM01755.1 50S ribosomal protein L17 [Halolactibacillus halophilus]GEM05108.1 50S ribosomal protein L17 [Halolactibacillus miurensis]